MAKGLIRKVIAGVGFAGAFYLGSADIPKILGDYYLSPKDFSQLKSCKVYNSDGKIWDDYMNTDIPKNQINWQEYTDEVLKRNPGSNIKNLSGWIYVPCTK